MTTNTYQATVRLSNSSHQKIRVQADSQVNARAMIEAQYGKGSIVSGPFKA